MREKQYAGEGGGSGCCATEVVDTQETEAAAEVV